MKKQRVAAMVFSILFSLIFLCGCYDYDEVNDTAIVAGIAIDEGVSAKYAVTVEIATLRSQDTTTELSSKTLTQEGETLESCLKHLVLISTKKLLFSHCNLILISEAVARKGIYELTDYLLRDPEFRPDLYLAVIQGSTAKEMFARDESNTDIWARDYAAVIKNTFEEIGSTAETNLFQIPLDQSVALLPVFRKRTDNEFEINGVAGLWDGVMEVLISPEITQTILLTSGEMRRGEMDLKGEGFEQIPCQIRSVKVHRTVESDPPGISVDLKCSVYLTAVPEQFDISTKAGLQEAEKILSDCLQKEILHNHAISFAEGQGKFWGYEIFLYRHKPELLEVWKNEGKNLDTDLQFSCQVNVTLEHFGYSDERISE